jgi:predicted ribosomally synthesized peptide with SipW-like signal peptide
MRKTLLGVAGIAVALTMIGGATFAAWSDFDEINDNTTGAGILKLDINGRDVNGTSLRFDNVRMAPGEIGFERKFLLASNNAESVPNAKLSVTFDNYSSVEGDGTTAPWGNGCTTQSEFVAEGEPADCAANGGEFGDEANFIIRWSKPKPLGDWGSGVCDPGGNDPGKGDVRGKPDLRLDDVTHDLGTLKPGEAVCVHMTMLLPSNATNASQGDHVNWNTRFDLVQA